MGVTWEVILLEEVRQWFDLLDDETATLVTDAIDILAQRGPNLGRPLADRITGSWLHNLKELRPGSAGRLEIRILFAFDPWRQAVLLVAGDKSGQWKDWYRKAVPLAEARFHAWVIGDDENRR